MTGTYFLLLQEKDLSRRRLIREKGSPDDQIMKDIYKEKTYDYWQSRYSHGSSLRL
jgi:hypothetical protein